MNVHHKTGRPPALSTEEEDEIIDRITENPFLTAVGIGREYGVSDHVISALFRRHGLKCRTAAHTLRLTPEQRINRIAFCEVMLEQWDEDRLESIIFSDEKMFCTEVQRRTNVYRPDNTRHEPKYLKVKDRSGRKSNNYWGAIGIEGPVTHLVWIEGPFIWQTYRTILNRYVIPMMNRFEDDGAPRIFMQDNASQHTAGEIMALFSRQRFQLMEWPPKSPDINPIENVWADMEEDWPVIVPWTNDALDDVVQERWNAQRNDPRKFFLSRHESEIILSLIPFKWILIFLFQFC